MPLYMADTDEKTPYLSANKQKMLEIWQVLCYTVKMTVRMDKFWVFARFKMYIY